MEPTNGNSENKIRKMIFNEVTFCLALVSLVSGVIFWVTNPQQDLQIQIVKLQSQVENNQTVVQALERIKNNDFVELQLKMDQIETRQIDILQALAAINQQLADKQYVR